MMVSQATEPPKRPKLLTLDLPKVDRSQEGKDEKGRNQAHWTDVAAHLVVAGMDMSSIGRILGKEEREVVSTFEQQWFLDKVETAAALGGERASVEKVLKSMSATIAMKIVSHALNAKNASVSLRACMWVMEYTEKNQPQDKEGGSKDVRKQIEQLEQKLKSLDEQVAGGI